MKGDRPPPRGERNKQKDEGERREGNDLGNFF